jgi:sensor histidine kinase YesM
MNAKGSGSVIVRLQLMIWVGVVFIIFFSVLSEDGLTHAIIYTPISIAFYLLIIYGNIKFLYPFFWEKGNVTMRILYVVLAIMLVGSAALGRGYLLLYLANKYVYVEKPEIMTAGMALSYVIASFLIFLLSFVYRIAIAYYSLKQQAEEILLQKSQAELNLLKSQVQPHFLFNTLNNIYYEAYREAPRTAGLIERLSDIMRYFVDESPKDEVSMQT